MAAPNTAERLRVLKLSGMAAALERQCTVPEALALPFDDRFSQLVDGEEQFRNDRRLVRFLRTAKFKVQASPEDINYAVHRGLNRQVMESLIGCGWIQNAQNVAITGPTGTGKTWLGCALGQAACRRGLTARYCRLSRLLSEMEISGRDGSLPKLRAQLAKTQLLILDDWALTPLTPLGRQHLADLVEDRSGERSLLLTSQLPADKWHAWIGEPTVADAILDRLVHGAHRIELRGESLRKLRAHKP